MRGPLESESDWLRSSKGGGISGIGLESGVSDWSRAENLIGVGVSGGESGGGGGRWKTSGLGSDTSEVRGRNTSCPEGDSSTWKLIHETYSANQLIGLRYH